MHRSECLPFLTCHIPRQRTLMDPSLPCPGCGTAFSKPRYQQSHLTQTTNPACIALRNTMFALDNELHPPRIPEAPVHPILPSNRHAFNTPESPHPSPNPGPSGPSDVDDKDGSSDNAGFDTRSEDLGADLEEHIRPSTPSEFISLPKQSQVEPVKVLFPGRRAGEVVSEGIPTMKEYENNLGGPTSNLYAPFNSEIDWELAKWARLRGPSATSFTELLQINGVCHSWHSLKSHLLTPSSSVNS
jgi:hypothetical protein